jgi:hypothetical protein
MSTRIHEPDDLGEDDGDRPSSARVESFLHGIEDRRAAARRTRWIVLAVVTAIGGVAILTALGIAPVEAENAVLSASVVVAGIAFGKE